ncbi:MAG: hypothetical protein LEGION0403_FIIPPAGN_01769 [Legionella sp.]|uniref:hypothetical protein n=1 Tax=Legionella sp. TaxID=459 RepID=UPI003D095A1A
MKKIMRFTGPLALSGLLISQISFAGYPNKNMLADQCRLEEYKLMRLSESKPRNKCAGDVAVAAAYLGAAETQIRHEHFDEALVSLHYSETELKEIAYTRTYCTQFSTLIKPAIARVIKISSELDVLERMKLKSAS